MIWCWCCTDRDELAQIEADSNDPTTDEHDASHRGVEKFMLSFRASAMVQEMTVALNRR